MAKGFEYDIDVNRKRVMSDTEIIKRLLHYVKPYIKSLVIAFSLVIIVVVLDLLGPLFISDVLDSLGEDQIPVTRIILIVVAWGICRI